MITMVDVHFCREGFCLAIPGRLTLERGVTLLVGPNGSGKSTLLEMLSTAAMPDEGEIWYRDRRVMEDLAGIRGMIGYLPADFQPYSHMTPRRFLQYMAVLKGVDPGIEVEEKLARTDLVPVCDIKIAKLSEGMKRRLGIAQALLGSPEVLLLDEPLTYLDGVERRKMIEFLTQYARGRTVVAASHELDEWDQVDRIVWLEQGQPAFFGPPELWVSGLGEKVWSKVLDPEELEGLESRRILARRWTGDRVRVRFFARTAPGDGFREEAPTLQEAYVIRREERRIGP